MSAEPRCAVCGEPCTPESGWWHHQRLNVDLHGGACGWVVNGEDLSGHTMLWHQPLFITRSFAPQPSLAERIAQAIEATVDPETDGPRLPSSHDCWETCADIARSFGGER